MSLEMLTEPMSPADRAAAKQEREAWDAMERRIAELEAALSWYGEQARLCRLIHSGGDAGRHALTADGGERARSALTK